MIRVLNKIIQYFCRELSVVCFKFLVLCVSPALFNLFSVPKPSTGCFCLVYITNDLSACSIILWTLVYNYLSWLYCMLNTVATSSSLKHPPIWHPWHPSLPSPSSLASTYKLPLLAPHAPPLHLSVLGPAFPAPTSSFKVIPFSLRASGSEWNPNLYYQPWPPGNPHLGVKLLIRHYHLGA